MGKDRVIKLIANLIGKSTAHKILVKYTNMPESINHMLSEIDNYRGQLSEYIIQYNWNIYDKQKIIKEAEKSLDEARWKFLDELSFGHYFDLDILIVYVLKLLLLERWGKINTADKTKILEGALAKA